jgi:hypothetical protein
VRARHGARVAAVATARKIQPKSSMKHRPSGLATWTDTEASARAIALREVGGVGSLPAALSMRRGSPGRRDVLAQDDEGTDRDARQWSGTVGTQQSCCAAVVRGRHEIVLGSLPRLVQSSSR